MTGDHDHEGGAASAPVSIRARTAGSPPQAETVGEPGVGLEDALAVHGHVGLLRGAGPLPRAVLIATTTTASYPISLSPPPPRCLFEAGFTPVTSLQPAVLDRLARVSAWHAVVDRHRSSVQMRRRRDEILSEVLPQVPPAWWDAIHVHHTLTVVVVNQVALARADGGRGLAAALRRGHLRHGHVLAGHVAADLPAAFTSGAHSLHGS